ncbi:MAG: hypothetical protein OXI43_09535 [Candidatus Poribacteria bacterium]|nr:hypothetical protein [Candidatus Poribacteria bacterium]
MKNTQLLLIFIAAIIVLAFLTITGCDEGMQMTKPIMPGPDPGEQNPGGQNPGEQDPEKPETPQPKTPTLTIYTVVQADDGSITVSGTSTELPMGETVTITLADTVTVTTTTDSEGAWSVTVPATETTGLAAGTTAVRAAASTAADDSSFEYTPPQPEQPENGTLTPAEAEQIEREIVADVLGDVKRHAGYDESIRSIYSSLFDMGTETGRATFRRFIEYEYKKSILATTNLPLQERIKLLDQYFEEAYGISDEYSDWLVHEVYLKEKPEDAYLLKIAWQAFDISMEHLLLRIDNPNATEEEILELLRESIRAGNVTIAV